MAKQYWGMNRGQHETDVTTGAADPGTQLVLGVEMTAHMTVDEIEQYLSMIRNFMLKGKWPPA